MNPDELRSRLAVAYPAELPPPDLAVRAERTAGRLRRRRAAAVTVAVALAVAIPLSAAALARPNQALTPANSGDPACSWDPKVLPRQGIATTDAQVAAWGSRVDPSVRATALSLARMEVHGDAHVVYAGTVDDATVVVYATQAAEGISDQALGAAAVGADGKVFTRAGARAPVPGPDAAISLLLPWPRRPAPPESFPYGPHYATNLLVALAPKGSRGIDFRGCRDGKPFTVQGDGDTLVRDVGTLDAPGELTVRTASGGVGFRGPVADLPYLTGRRPEVALTPLEPVELPSTLRQVFRDVGQGAGAQEKAAQEDRGTVLVRCRRLEGTGPVEVYVDDTLLGAVKCDGSTELVVENRPVGGWFSLDRPYGWDSLSVPVSYQLVVAVPR